MLGGEKFSNNKMNTSGFKNKFSLESMLLILLFGYVYTCQSICCVVKLNYVKKYNPYEHMLKNLSNNKSQISV